MEKVILVAVNEITSQNFGTIAEARKSYSKRELLEMYLEYEGIIGYTDIIIALMKTLGFNSQSEE